MNNTSRLLFGLLFSALTIYQLDGKVIEISQTDDFERAIQGDNLTVVEFYGSGCSHCKNFVKKYEALSEQYPNVTFYKLETSKNRDLSSKRNINGVPAFQLFKNSEQIAEVVGALEDELTNNIKKYSEAE